MALIELVQEDRLKFIVSQNLVGLHIKSGIDQDMISELHCNTHRNTQSQDIKTMVNPAATN